MLIPGHHLPLPHHACYAFLLQSSKDRLESISWDGWWTIWRLEASAQVQGHLLCRILPVSTLRLLPLRRRLWRIALECNLVSPSDNRVLIGILVIAKTFRYAIEEYLGDIQWANPDNYDRYDTLLHRKHGAWGSTDNRPLVHWYPVFVPFGSPLLAAFGHSGQGLSPHLATICQVQVWLGPVGESKKAISNSYRLVQTKEAAEASLATSRGNRRGGPWF